MRLCAVGQGSEIGTLDARVFQPGEYAYERTRGAIEHCQEHLEGLAAGQAGRAVGPVPAGQA